MVVVTGALLALSQVVRANADATPVVAVLASSSLAVSVLALRANARARVRVIQEGARSARETIVRSSLAWSKNGVRSEGEREVEMLLCFSPCARHEREREMAVATTYNLKAGGERTSVIMHGAVVAPGPGSARPITQEESRRLTCLAVIGALNADIVDRAGDESHGLAACHTPLLVADEVGVSCALGAVGAEGSCANQTELVAELAFLLVKVVVVVAAEGVADRVVRAVRNTGGLEEVRVHLRVAGGTDDWKK